MKSTVPYAIVPVTVPTDPPMTWEVLIVAATIDPRPGSPEMLRRLAPLKVHAQDYPEIVAAVADQLAKRIRVEALRGGHRITAFVKAHEKLQRWEERAMIDAIMKVLGGSAKGNGAGRQVIVPGARR